MRDPKRWLPGGFCVLVLFFAATTPVFGQGGYWATTELSISNAEEPSINNNGEMVWIDWDGGISSSVHGKLTQTGILPHLSNSGEVVYADWFGGPYWDLVSTTRGRLTYGGIIDVNTSGFDVNASGEVVYMQPDTNNVKQIFSTVRGQITHDASDHVNPCINDSGEIVWNQFIGNGTAVVSSTRGAFLGNYPWLQDLNNRGDFCFSGNIEGPPGFYSYPHLFSYAHGPVSSDPTQFQWGGSMNDVGTLVWAAPDVNGSTVWYLYSAQWVPLDTTPPVISKIAASPNVLRRPVNHLVPVQVKVAVSDDQDPAPTCRIVQVSCNEPLTPSGQDWVITGPLSVELRVANTVRHRSRIYTIVVEATDASGNVSSASVDVTVQGGFTRVPR